MNRSDINWFIILHNHWSCLAAITYVVALERACESSMETDSQVNPYRVRAGFLKNVL
jgi:hypothetical protein